MKILVCIIINISLAISCAHGPQWQGPTPLLEVAADFYHYWDMYNPPINLKHNITIDWMDNNDKYNIVDKEVIAFKTSEAIVIKINRDFWGTLDGYQQQQVIFHKLGHFLLLRSHNNKTILCDSYGMQCPISIMHYDLRVPSRYYQQHHDRYMIELFQSKGVIYELQ